MSSTPAPATSGSDTVNLSKFGSGITYDGGAGNDYISGSTGADTIRGGTGADRIQGGAGSDTYVFVAGDLVGSLGQSNGQNGSSDHIIDFQGAGTNTASGFQDKIAFYGYSSDAFIEFDHYGANRVQQTDGSYKLVENQKLQYYKVVDPNDHSRDGFILVQMQDGVSQLKGDDVVFHRDLVMGTATGEVIEAGGADNGVSGQPSTGGKLDAKIFNEATTFKAVDPSVLKGQYGSFTFASDGTWTYTLDNTKAETQALKADETKTETLSVQTLDGTEKVISVTVNGANDAPLITSNGGSAVATISFAENSTAAVTSLMATDVDGTTISYSIVPGGNGSMFSITDQGVLSFLTPPDFENPTDMAPSNSYEVMVQAFDGATGYDTQLITVNVANVVEKPTIAAVYTGLQADPNDFDSMGDPTAQNASKFGTSGSDTIYGGAGNDRINGGAGNDVIYAGSGDDGVDGNNDLDTIFGGSGNDTIQGGSNNDLLVGGYGADVLSGNSGADIFRFLSPKDTGDAITDFNKVDGDKIDISALDGSAGSTPFAVGGDNQEFGVGHSVIWTQNGADTLVLVDTDGVLNTAEFSVTLKALTASTLAAGDFIV